MITSGAPLLTIMCNVALPGTPALDLAGVILPQHQFVCRACRVTADRVCVCQKWELQVDEGTTSTEDGAYAADWWDIELPAGTYPLEISTRSWHAPSPPAVYDTDNDPYWLSASIDGTVVSAGQCGSRPGEVHARNIRLYAYEAVDGYQVAAGITLHRTA